MASTGNVATLAPVPEGGKRRQRTLLGDAVRRFSRNALAMTGLGILIFIFLLATFADVLAPYDYDQVFFDVRANTRPFVVEGHLLGTDGATRDYLSRLIYGSRTSLLVGLSVPLIAFAIGIPLGAVAGYYGGRVDFVVLRVVEVMTAVPPLIIALVLLTVTGNGLFNVIFVLSITTWIEPTRLARAQFLTFREKEFVSSARAIGASDLRIALTHMLPNALTPLVVAFTFAIPLAIYLEAGLSFLGLGIPEPTASWGRMVGANVGSAIQVHYHLALFPTIMVALTMLGFSFVGDGLQEALDPGRSE